MRWRPGARLLAAFAFALCLAVAAGTGGRPASLVAAGPPYPAPVEGQVVYDTAGAFSRDTAARATEIIRGIEARTGAQVVVYTQVKPESDTGAAALLDAEDLGSQWGVGRKGFDDGLVILFDLQGTLKHGQVALATGAGFRASFLSDADARSIIENDMRPFLTRGDLDGALRAALDRVDRATTPESAQRLAFFRVLNALIGFGGILVGLGLVVWFAWNWLRYASSDEFPTACIYGRSYS